ncbi:MAG TPA: MBL fold metallo-hydrolase [Spirochaetota bacterium]|nr:MBL fold metallo-hydrolase [Spirochaetota bacterium]HOM38564.1 MBL fold metallo-hydrolase [Spirochaetota bacterium]HPQ49701.1 MBL fold metallo-hydrolase [Spirochaetota bacterium]
MSFKVRFWGVRGSYPAPGKDFLIGGNTTCIEIEINNNILIFDAGTGIIKLGKYITSRIKNNQINIFLFFTHYHQDHIQGLPFFGPIYMPNIVINFFGPKLAEKTLYENIMANMYMPFFPVNFEETLSKKFFNNIKEKDTVIIDENSNYRLSEEYIEKKRETKDKKEIIITAHKNFIHPKDGSFYYSIEFDGKKIVFATDIEGFVGGDVRLINTATNADILIHDSQYLPEVYTNKYYPTQGFGHSTPIIAADVARKANVKKLILTHHDPNSTDKDVKKIQTIARKYFKESYYAYEIMEIDLEKDKTSEFTWL